MGLVRNSQSLTGVGWWPTFSISLERKTQILGTLKRLKLDNVDLYQAHRFDVETPLEETMLAFMSLGSVLS